MKYIPYKKGVLKDIISPVGCNSLVEVGVYLGGLKWCHSIVCSYHMMDVLSGLGVDKVWRMGVSCLVSVSNVTCECMVFYFLLSICYYA